MKKYSILLVVFISFLSFPSSFAFNRGVDCDSNNVVLVPSYQVDSIVNWIQKVNEQHSFIQCDFVRNSFLRSMNKEFINKGSFLYKTPSSLVMNYSSPKGDLMLMSKKIIYMRHGGKLQKMRIAHNPMMKRLHRMLSSCMKGDITGMGLGKMDIYMSMNTYCCFVQLVPSRSSRSMKKIELQFRKVDGALMQLSFFEASGNIIKYSFDAICFDTIIPQEQFEIDYYL